MAAAPEPGIRRKLQKVETPVVQLTVDPAVAEMPDRPEKAVDCVTVGGVESFADELHRTRQAAFLLFVGVEEMTVEILRAAGDLYLNQCFVPPTLALDADKGHLPSWHKRFDQDRLGEVVEQLRGEPAAVRCIADQISGAYSDRGAFRDGLDHVGQRELVAERKIGSAAKDSAPRSEHAAVGGESLRFMFVRRQCVTHGVHSNIVDTEHLGDSRNEQQSVARPLASKG